MIDLKAFPLSYGFDIETAGDDVEYPLQPFRLPRGEAFIKAASVAVDDNSYGVIRPSFDDLMAMLSLAVNTDRYIVGWNVAFDAAWCIAAGLTDLVFKAKWLDAMLLWKHLTVEPESEVTTAKRKSYSLESAMLEFYPDHSEFKEFKDFEAEDEESLELLLNRNKNDAIWTLRLAKLFWQRLSNKQKTAALIEARCIPMVAWTKVTGIKSNVEDAKDLAKKLAGEAVDIYKELLQSSPEIEGVNISSSPQLQDLIYNKWNLPAERFSKKTGKPSTDKYALYDLAAIDERANLLKKLREAKNNMTKYASGTIKSLEYNGDGFVRPQAKIFSTYTSRLTYGSKDKGREATKKGFKKVEKPSGVPLHQWKRGKEYRRLICPPEGYALCEFDFAGQEFRWMAVASEDEVMLSLCAPGEDAHSYMGAQVALRDYAELKVAAKSGEDDQAVKDRKCGKFCNLSYQYRVSAKTATVKARVEYDLDVDQYFIQNTLNIYKQSYTGVERYWANQINNCKHLGYAETFAGRRVQLSKSWSGATQWPMESTAINYPIQGTGGDQKYLALAVARNYLPEFGGYFYYELHDGLFFIFPIGKELKAAELFHYKLSNLPYKEAWGIDLPIKFPVDAQIGPSWGDLVDIKRYAR